MEMFISEVTGRREKTRYECPPMLILDGCRVHDGDAF
jgi:hypothetical protein